MGGGGPKTKPGAFTDAAVVGKVKTKPGGFAPDGNFDRLDLIGALNVNAAVQGAGKVNSVGVVLGEGPVDGLIAVEVILSTSFEELAACFVVQSTWIPKDL